MFSIKIHHHQSEIMLAACDMEEVGRQVDRSQELTETLCVEPTKRENASSNLRVLGPMVSHPDLRVSTTSLISSSVMETL